MAILIALAAGVSWLARYEGIDLARKLGEVALSALALAVVLIPVVLKTFRWPSLKLITDKETEADAADLAAGLRREWDREQSLLRRGGAAITPMRLRWKMPMERGDLHGSFGEILPAFSLASSRLVILGESGGGKSTLALELARRLVESRTPGDRVPVVLHAAQWHPGQKLADWVAGQLARDHPGLARRGRGESGNLVTRAQALVAAGKVIPILDGLDEIAGPLRAVAIAEINRYETDKPLVVACRTGAYLDAVRDSGGKPVARAAELTLCDLRPAEIKDFLASVQGERWSRLFGRLEAEAGGALLLALGNPLMLSLCQAVYTDRSPDELADRYRFAQRAAIEDHLLGRFVQAAYAATPGAADTGKFRCTGEQAQRWLSFLAGHSDQSYLPWAYQTAGATPPAPDLSWWHLYRAERGGWRILGPLVRSVLRIIVIAALAVWILVQRGYWRDGRHRSPVHTGSLLEGPLGRLARPVADQLLPSRSADLIIAGIAVGFVLMAELAHSGIPMLPVRVSIKPFRTLRAVLGAALILPLLAAGVMIWRLTQERHHLPVVTFIDSRSTLVTLLAVALGSLLWLPGTLIVPTDRRGAVSSPESLQLDRQADVVVTLLSRSAVAVILLVWSGAQIALAYTIFAAAMTLIALMLGGQFSFGSRSYTDACWSLRLSHHLPRQVMAFMADAESRGVLRAIGADYEFRHIRVQQQLHDSWGRSRWLNRGTRREKRRDLRERIIRREKSLAGLAQTVQEYRTIAGRSDSPSFGEFGPTLAIRLTALAAKLGALGRRDDEVDVLSERTEVYRNLAERDPGTFGPELARSLSELAARLEVTERFSESFGSTREAVDIWRLLARLDTGYQPDLAESLSRLVWRLRPLAGHADNLEAIEDVVACLRELESDDATVRPWLAEALVRQAFTYRASGRPDEYDQVMAQALDLYRQLSGEKRYHDRKRSELRSSAVVSFPRPESESAISGPVVRVVKEGEVVKFLRNNLGKPAEAYRHFAKTRSSAFLPDLKCALDRISAWRLSPQIWKSYDYGAVSREAQRIWFIYLRYFDNSYLWGRAGLFCLLRDLAEPLWKAGQHQDAMTVIEIARGLGRENYLSIDYEKWIHSLQRNSRTYRWRWILAENGWSLAMGSPEWQKCYARLLGTIAGYMDDLAFDLAVQGRKAEAAARAKESAAAYREAVNIYRKLSEAHPVTFLPDLATSLDTLAAELRKTGNPEHEEDAKAASAEAAMLRHGLGLAPDHCEPGAP